MLFFGIALGLVAALAQSLCYLASRWYTLGRGGGRMRLLTLSHLFMGATCLPLLPLLWPEDLPPVGVWGPDAVGVAAFYCLGQVGLLATLHYVDASRVSPLLGLKVAMLALLVTLMGGQLLPLQWSAVGLCVLAAVGLNYSGGRLPPGAVAALLWTCANYALSDWFILTMIDAMAPVPRPLASMFGVCVTHVLLGAVSLPLLLRFGSRRRRDWLGAMPYTYAWLAAMVMLYACIALLSAEVGPRGVVLANILQSTRGVISIVLAVALVRLGHERLERRVSTGVFWRRLGAAAMMLAAIAIFVLSGEAHDHDDARRVDPTPPPAAGPDVP